MAADSEWPRMYADGVLRHSGRPSIGINAGGIHGFALAICPQSTKHVCQRWGCRSSSSSRGRRRSIVWQRKEHYASRPVTVICAGRDEAWVGRRIHWEQQPPTLTLRCRRRRGLGRQVSRPNPSKDSCGLLRRGEKKKQISRSSPVWPSFSQ